MNVTDVKTMLTEQARSRGLSVKTLTTHTSADGMVCGLAVCRADLALGVYKIGTVVELDWSFNHLWVSGDSNMYVH